MGQIVDIDEDLRVVRDCDIPIISTESYSNPDTVARIRLLSPDIFVVHSPFIVGPRVLALAPGRVIGGHPGITPDFRGSYSAFWAMAQGKPEFVGWSVFLLDEGIDTGPLFAQGRLTFAPDESHMVLSWRAMACEAQAQAALVLSLDKGEDVPLSPVQSVPPGSYYGAPGVADLIRYWRAVRRWRFSRLLRDH